MKFSEINPNIIGKEVKLLSLKNSKLEENDIIKKNKIYKIFDISKNYLDNSKLTLKLIDENLHTFWVNHYDVELIE